MSSFNDRYRRQLEQRTALLTKISGLEADNARMREALEQAKATAEDHKGAATIRRLAQIFVIARDALEGQG